MTSSPTHPAFLIHGQALPRIVPFRDKDEACARPEDATAQFRGLQQVTAIHGRCVEDFAALDAAGAEPDALDAVLARLRAEARQGDTAAAHVLGRTLLEGRRGLSPDPVAGLDWLMRAAQQGWAEAQVLVGHYYCHVARQPAQALPYLWAAAEQDNARAQMILAVRWAEGVDGVLPPDALASLRYLRLAADGQDGDPYYRGIAAALLARRLSTGDGLPRDAAEAIRRHRQALSLGYGDDRAELIALLRQDDAKAHASEIVQLTQAALAAGDQDVQRLQREDEWRDQLATWRGEGLSVDFWTRRYTFVRRESRSETNLHSTPGIGKQAPMVYTTRTRWQEIFLRDSEGHEHKIVPDGELPTLNPGQAVVVLYAGPAQADGNATGYPYRLYKLGTSEAAVLTPLSRLPQALGRTPPSGWWLVLAFIGLLMLLSGSAAGLIGLLVAGASAWRWYIGRARVADLRFALETHISRIGQWLATAA